MAGHRCGNDVGGFLDRVCEGDRRSTGTGSGGCDGKHHRA